MPVEIIAIRVLNELSRKIKLKGLQNRKKKKRKKKIDETTRAELELH